MRVCASLCVLLACLDNSTSFSAAHRFRHARFASGSRLRAAEASAPALVQWSIPGYRKPLHWVQKVAHLEDALAFYQANFNFIVYRHEEFDSGCEATCNGPYGGAWSKTMVGPLPGEAERFCLELVSNYGVHRYERGSDLRSIAVRRSAFVGDADLITAHGDGERYVRTPDGHFLHLVEDEDENKDAQSLRVKPHADVFRHISLHVSNVTRAAAFYEHVLGARVTWRGAADAVLCTWDTLSSDGAPAAVAANEADTVASVPISISRVGVELRPLPDGVNMVLGEAHGRFAIETEDGAIAGIAARAQRAAAAGTGRVLHGPVALQPHGEEVVIIADDDGGWVRRASSILAILTPRLTEANVPSVRHRLGHEYCFVDARGFKRCVDVATRRDGNSIDWEYRRQINLKASADYVGDGGFGPHVAAVDATAYGAFLDAHAGRDVVLELFAPWCVLCGKRKPLLAEVARRVGEASAGRVAFAAMDPTKTPFAEVGDDTLRLMMSYAKTNGYPMVFYLPATDRGNPEEFVADWTAEAFKTWIEDRGVDLSTMDTTPLFKADEQDHDDNDDDCDQCGL